jgi:hypothetical protein
MGKKEEREWCALVFDVEGDGLAMEFSHVLGVFITIIVYEDILPGLVAVNKRQEGDETETHGGLKTNKKSQSIECPSVVRTHQQPITGFMPRRLFDAFWGPSQVFQ